MGAAEVGSSMFWEGLNVRLAISEGETATLSGQMSMQLHKRRERLLPISSVGTTSMPILPSASMLC
jgi:hypothetical protein